jgi:hypothetical protein
MKIKFSLCATPVLGGLPVQSSGQGHFWFDNVSGQGTPAPATISTGPGNYNPLGGAPGAYVGSNYTASVDFLNGTLVLIMALVASVPSLGRCQRFDFDNWGEDGSPTAPVYGPDPSNSNRQQWGNAPEANPPATQSYLGVALAGTNYSVEGWYSLTPVADVFALDTDTTAVPGSLTTFFPGGYFGNRFPFMPQFTSNGSYGAYLQIRVWDNADGQYAS